MTRFAPIRVKSRDSARLSTEIPGPCETQEVAEA